MLIGQGNPLCRCPDIRLAGGIPGFFVEPDFCVLAKSDAHAEIVDSFDTWRKPARTLALIRAAPAPGSSF